MIKKTGTWISVVFVGLALVAFYFYLNRNKNIPHDEEIMFKTTGQLRVDLKDFLANVEATLTKLKADAEIVQVDKLSVDSLNKYFSELTGSKELLYGVLLLGDNINYVLFRDENSWVYTYNNLTDSLINWQRIDKNLQPIPNANWTDTYSNFMNERHFGSASRLSLLEKDKYLWSTVQSTLPDRHDLIFNAFPLKSGEDTDIAALIYKTTEIGKRFSRLMVFENPLVSVITENEKIVSPIRTTDTSLIKSFRILEDNIIRNYQTWKSSFSEKPHTFQFEQFNKWYYSRFDTLSPQLGIKACVLTIQKEDIDESKKTMEEAYLYAVILLFLFAFFAFLTTYNKYRKSTKVLKENLRFLSDEEIELMIKQGETENVEFKSSLRWDYREEKVNKVLEDVILKSIAAFANAKGGVLMIGVSDDMNILGLEPDFKTLKKQNVDYFELHLRKLVNNQYGIRFSNKHILMQFPRIQQKHVCIIHINAGDSPLYLKTKNKQGQEVEKFYVRSGNASQEITSLKEINEYINSHFTDEG